MTAPCGIVTLTTDFGTADGFVGAMKGRMLQLAPQARLVDISHDIAPQDITQGAWCLRQAALEFPPGTLHLAVVDPGVGDVRAALLIETERYLLVGPDNGVLSLAARADRLRRVWRIDPQAGPWSRSTTFEGLSLFAPVAASVVQGMTPSAIGVATDEFVELVPREPEVGAEGVVGEVVRFDRFGNGITNIHRTLLGGAHLAAITAESGHVLTLCTSYADMAQRPDGVGALWNSAGLLELAVWRGNARERLRMAPGSRVRLALRRR